MKRNTLWRQQKGLHGSRIDHFISEDLFYSGRHNSVDKSAATILRPQVRFPSTTSKVFSVNF